LFVLRRLLGGAIGGLQPLRWRVVIH
jgi:hypothetical protein